MQSFAKTLAETHKVRVFTLTEIGIDAPQKETVFNQNIEVFYINHKQYNKRNFFIRAFFEFFYAVKLSRLSATKKADVLLTTSPFMFMIPGVFFFGGKTPKILDLRDKATCPCLSVFSKKPAEEVKELAIQAITKQMEAMIEVHGEDYLWVATLRKELNDVSI
jgi:hypothetical protein